MAENLEQIRKLFEHKLQILEKSLAEARIAQRNAPSAMESHSDTTRSEMEKMVTALEIEINNLMKKMALIPNSQPPANSPAQLWQQVKVDNAGTPLKVIVVPDGMGGDTIGEIKLISETTRLGRAILGKKAGESCDIDSLKVEVLQIG